MKKEKKNEAMTKEELVTLIVNFYIKVDKGLTPRSIVELTKDLLSRSFAELRELFSVLTTSCSRQSSNSVKLVPNSNGGNEWTK